MRIALASDHAGYELKLKVRGWLEKEGHSVTDYGTDSTDSVDYPDFVPPVAEAVLDGQADRGILVCGAGIGMSIAANKIAGIRASLCYTVETARLSRAHNDANILALGGWTIDHDLALEIVRTWLETEFDGGRHLRRVEKIMALEKRRLK